MAAPVTAAVGRKGRGGEGRKEGGEGRGRGGGGEGRGGEEGRGRGRRKKGSNYAARTFTFDFTDVYQSCT